MILLRLSLHRQQECIILYKMQRNNKYALLVGVNFILFAISFIVYSTASLDKLTMCIISKGDNVHLSSIISK